MAEQPLQFVGKYEMVEQHNVDDYLKALGVNVAKRALAATITARIECSVDGDEWTVINGGLRDKILKFKFGEEVDDETPDGRKVKAIFTLEDGKIVHRESWDDKTAVMTHEIIDDGQHWFTVMETGTVRATRKYKRQQ